MRLLALPLVLLLPGAALAAPLPAASGPGLAELRRLDARYAPVDLRVDLARVPPAERAALAKLVEAARVMDALFLEQVWGGNEAVLLRLLEDETPIGRARLRYFLRNKGPWDRLDEDRAFLPGVPAKPEGANFFPADATREELERWAAGLDAAARRDATGFFTLVRRSPAGGFAPVPYAVAYAGALERAATHLRDAAAATQDPALRRFLELRAEAFRSNDYYASDVAWMELDGLVEPTVGPYEVYEDEIFNQKAAFEAFIGVRDDEETEKLARFAAELQGIENALPIDDRYKNPKLGALAPIRVVDEIFAAGDANRGVQTAAYNLPNDERVVKEKGTKRVMLKNVQQAKFDKVLLPIAKVALGAADRKHVAFEPFFTHILMHELVHGLGPHEVTVDGQPTTVRQRLADTYSALEEAKADVAGLFALQKLIDDGKIDRAMEKTLYPTFLASSFRSIRFGINEAHGKGMAVQLNWFLDAKAITARPDGTFGIDPARMKEAVRSLTREIMTIQAKGDRAAAKALLEKYGVVRPEVKKVLDRLASVPVDIAPRFVTAEELTRR
jgi:hypothetical protein